MSLKTRSGRLTYRINELRGSKKVGTGEDFCTSVVENIFFASVFLPLAYNIACCDTSAMANTITCIINKQFKVSKKIEIDNNGVLHRCFLNSQ